MPALALCACARPACPRHEPRHGAPQVARREGRRQKKQALLDRQLDEVRRRKEMMEKRQRKTSVASGSLDSGTSEFETGGETDAEEDARQRREGAFGSLSVPMSEGEATLAWGGPSAPPAIHDDGPSDVEKSELLSSFAVVAECDVDVAKLHLEESGWDLEGALATFLETGGGQDTADALGSVDAFWSEAAPSQPQPAPAPNASPTRKGPGIMGLIRPRPKHTDEAEDAAAASAARAVPSVVQSTFSRLRRAVPAPRLAPAPLPAVPELTMPQKAEAVRLALGLDEGLDYATLAEAAEEAYGLPSGGGLVERVQRAFDESAAFAPGVAATFSDFEGSASEAEFTQDEVSAAVAATWRAHRPPPRTPPPACAVPEAAAASGGVLAGSPGAAPPPPATPPPTCALLPTTVPPPPATPPPACAMSAVSDAVSTPLRPAPAGPPPLVASETSPPPSATSDRAESELSLGSRESDLGEQVARQAMLIAQQRQMLAAMQEQLQEERTRRTSEGGEGGSFTMDL